MVSRLGGDCFGSPALDGKITRALGGLLRIAVGQSVGAGCRFAGTLSSQIRHIPGGGRYSFGIGAFFSESFWPFVSVGRNDCPSPEMGKRSKTTVNITARNCMTRAYPVNCRGCLLFSALRHPPSDVRSSVSKRDPRRSSGPYDVMIRINASRNSECLGERYRDDVRRLQRDHVSPPLILDSFDGRPPESGR